MHIPEEKLEKAQNAGAPVYIQVGISPLTDSAGGRQVGFTWRNIGTKTIKYLIIETSLINQVGDDITCSIGYSGSVRFTGPVKPNETRRGDSASKCYDVPPSTLIVDRLTVVYMDDSQEIFNRDELQEIGALHPDS